MCNALTTRPKKLSMTLMCLISYKLQSNSRSFEHRQRLRFIVRFRFDGKEYRDMVDTKEQSIHARLVIISLDLSYLYRNVDLSMAHWRIWKSIVVLSSRVSSTAVLPRFVDCFDRSISVNWNVLGGNKRIIYYRPHRVHHRLHRGPIQARNMRPMCLFARPRIWHSDSSASGVN